MSETKSNWLKVGEAHCASSNRSVVVKVEDRSFVLNISELLEMVAGHIDFVNVVELEKVA